MSGHRIWLTGSLALLTAMGADRALAQTYPAKTITVVSAAAAGGPGDTAARLIAEHMAPHIGGQVVVENVPGAGGVLGTTRVARAEPDGHTILVHQTGITIAAATAHNVGFDVKKDFAVVGLVGVSNSILVGRKSLPANTFAELIDWMKGPGKPAKFAHGGNGTLGYLTIALLMKTTGVEPAGVSYRGVGPALNDVVGGHVDLVFAGIVSGAPLVQAGTIKAYAVVGDTRTRLLPNLPTVVELGIPEVSAPFWHGMFVPAATPRPIVERLNAALRKALDSPQLRKTYEETGVDVFPSDMLSIEAATRFVHSEVDRWSKVAASAQVK